MELENGLLERGLVNIPNQIIDEFPVFFFTLRSLSEGDTRRLNHGNIPAHKIHEANQPPVQNMIFKRFHKTFL
ncbi:hypothetical protein BMS3Bbin03_00655 [bacterium BMS3Bbin03]|nr:hypothetical protein BMS3Bbin03_00655 [bacterium BMS3Bbin03]